MARRREPKHPPKSPIRRGVRTASQSDTHRTNGTNSAASRATGPSLSTTRCSTCSQLCCCARSPRPAAERALRRVALGRKNFLFVGGAESGKNLAGLYSLVATCEARSINPFEYLSDVLNRLPDQPMSRIAELLPGAWAEQRRQCTDGYVENEV